MSLSIKSLCITRAWSGRPSPKQNAGVPRESPCSYQHQCKKLFLPHPLFLSSKIQRVALPVKKTYEKSSVLGVKFSFIWDVDWRNNIMRCNKCSDTKISKGMACGFGGVFFTIYFKTFNRTNSLAQSISVFWQYCYLSCSVQTHLHLKQRSSGSYRRESTEDQRQLMWVGTKHLSIFGLSLKMAIPTSGRKKNPKCPDGADEGRTQKPVLGLMRGICAPARISAVLTGERKPPPTRSHTCKPTWGFLNPRSLLCPLSPNNAMCGSVQGRSYADF